MPQSIKLTFEDVNFKNGYLLLSELQMIFFLRRRKTDIARPQKEKEPFPLANYALILCLYQHKLTASELNLTN